MGTPIFRTGFTLAFPGPVAPADPQTIFGTQANFNVVQVDEDYTVQTADAVVIVTADIIVTLPGTTSVPENPETLATYPLLGTPVLVVADGTNITVSGPLAGGLTSTVIPAGSMTFFSFSPVTDVYNFFPVGAPSGSTSVAVLTTLVNYNVKPGDVLVEAPLNTGACLCTLPGGAGSPYTPTIGEKHTFKNTSTDAVHSLTITVNAGAVIEDPTDPGANLGLDSVIITGQGFQYTYMWDGFKWWIVAT